MPRDSKSPPLGACWYTNQPIQSLQPALSLYQTLAPWANIPAALHHPGPGKAMGGHPYGPECQETPNSPIPTYSAFYSALPTPSHKISNKVSGHALPSHPLPLPILQLPHGPAGASECWGWTSALLMLTSVSSGHTRVKQTLGVF